jgi:hypothetical protein
MALMSAGSSNPDTWGAITRYDLEIMSTYVTLFVTQGAPNTLEPNISTPQKQLQNLLCEACYDVSDDILSSVSPYDELCESLYTCNTEVQIAAFRLLKRITASMVQTKSLKMELNTKDASFEETISAKLIKGASRVVSEVEPGVDVQDKVRQDKWPTFLSA